MQLAQRSQLLTPQRLGRVRIEGHRPFQNGLQDLQGLPAQLHVAPFQRGKQGRHRRASALRQVRGGTRLIGGLESLHQTLHVFDAARRAGVPRIVYASSSSVYGDRPDLPKHEDQPPAPISPYAVSKAATEQYGRVWSKVYGIDTIGLRYFNVFGPRQDPHSEYAIVVPRFIFRALAGEPVEVHGDGEQSRDFTYIDNVVHANVLASRAVGAGGESFNVGCGERTSLLAILERLERMLGRKIERQHTPVRAGDVRHTLADISHAKRLLGYEPLVPFDEGFRRTVEYFRTTFARS